MRVTSAVDTVASPRPGADFGPYPNAIAQCGVGRAGTSAGAARVQIIPRPATGIAQGPPRATEVSARGLRIVASELGPAWVSMDPDDPSRPGSGQGRSAGRGTGGSATRGARRE